MAIRSCCLGCPGGDALVGRRRLDDDGELAMVGDETPLDERLARQGAEKRGETFTHLGGATMA